MAVTISRYNHTRTRYVSGLEALGDTRKLMLCSAATFDATHTTLAAITKTEISGNGYTAGGITIADWAVSVINTNGCKVDATDPTVTASGGSIAAAYGIIYNATDADSPPLYFINFDGTVTAPDGTPWVLEINASGLETFNDPA